MDASPVTRPCPYSPLYPRDRRLSHHIQKFSCQKHTISACRGRRSDELRYLRQQSHRFCSQWVQACWNGGRGGVQGVAGTLGLTLMRSPSESCPPTPLPPARGPGQAIRQIKISERQAARHFGNPIPGKDWEQ